MSDIFQSHLPCTMRHLSKSEALSRGRELAVFLRDAMESMAQAGTQSEQNAYGIFLCFDLLSDYLDMAAGEYGPFLSVTKKEELFSFAEEVAEHE